MNSFNGDDYGKDGEDDKVNNVLMLTLTRKIIEGDVILFCYPDDNDKYDCAYGVISPR